MLESIWPKILGYLNVVKSGWQQHVHHADPCRVLDTKFQNTAKSLKSWSQKFVKNIIFQLGVAKEVTYQLDRAQD
jgi:hypothetical protein